MILLTGGSGKLGSTIIKSNLFKNLISPSMNELNITDRGSVKNFFENNDFDIVIHCAAITKMKECEENPLETINTNIIGTCNLIKEVLELEKRNKKIKFIHISTDGVYNGIKGNYSEKDQTIPYNLYGWTKLGAECSVNSLKNFCIIRTSFFDPEKLNFKESPNDIYSSKIPTIELTKAIKILINKDFIGTINIGANRKSLYEIYREYLPSIKPCKIKDIEDKIPIKLPRDSSLDISLWKSIKNFTR